MLLQEHRISSAAESEISRYMHEPVMHSCSNNRAVINYDEPCIETSFFLLPLKDGVHTHTRFWRHWQWGEHAMGFGGARRGCGTAGQDDAARGSAGVGAVQRCTVSKQAPCAPRRKGAHDTYTGQHARMRQRVSMRRICTCMRATRVHARGKGAICTAGACMCVRHCVPLPTRCSRGDVFQSGLAASPRRPRGRPSASRCCSGCLVG